MTTVAAPIKTYGSHPDSPPKGMLTEVLFNDLVHLNERTNDGRLLRDTGFDSRELPLTFSAMTATQHGEPGRAEAVGHIDYMEVYDDGRVRGKGWLMDSQHARNMGRMVQTKVLRGNSVELSVRDYEVDFDMEAMKLLIDFTDYQISATTLVANPAMEGCYVELGDPGFDFGSVELSDAVVTAAASFTEGAFQADILGRTPVGVGAFKVLEMDADETVEFSVDLPESAPPAAWFADPGFDRVTPGRILPPDDKGRIEVYGHLASWDTPHLAVPGTTMFAPRSRTDYAYFANGSVLCDDYSEIPVGVLTMGAGHADKSLDWRAAQDHYDDACEGWAAVAVGEDAFGIWYHGYVLPGTDPEKVERARSLGISGDWRRVRGNLELVAALSVNARGFPLARPSAFSSSGVQQALVGAGAVALPRDYVLADAPTYVPLDPDARIAINLAANFARKAEATEIREALVADQQRDLAEIEAVL